MALTFGATTAEKVDCGSGSTLDLSAAAQSFSLLMWIYPTTLTTGRRLFTKGDTTPTVWKSVRLSNATGDVRLLVDRATTDTDYITNTTPISSTNAWHFMGFTYNSAATPVVHIYHGTLTAAATEGTYSTSNNGSGNVVDDSSGNFIIGNDSAGSPVASFQGRIGPVMYLPSTVLTLAQCVDWQFRPKMLSGAKGFWYLGHAGTGTQADLTGNLNSGSPSAGLTQASGLPLGPWFPSSSLVGWRGSYTAPATSAVTGNLTRPDRITDTIIII